MQRLSDVTGQSAEQLQIMKYQGSALGVELDTMTGAQAKLTKSMNAAHNGTKAQVAAFKELGVSVTDSNGNLRNSNDVFNEAISKLGAMQNSTERDAMAMTIFGKSAMQLNPLIKAGGDQLAAMAEEAKNNGAVMSNEAVAGLDAFGDSLDATKLAIKGMAGTIAASALPMLQNFTSLIGNLTGALNSALKSGDFSQFGTVLTNGISSAITQLTSMTAQFVPVATQLMSGIVGALVSAIPTVLPALTDGVVQLIQSIATIIQENGPMLIQAGVQAIVSLISGITQSLPQIINAGVSVLTSLIDSLTQQIPTLIPVAMQAILTIVNGLINNLPKIIDSAIQIILALVQGIMNALPQLLEEAPKIITSIIQGIVDALPKIIDMAPQIITSVIKGVINALPQLIQAAPQIVSAVISGIIQAIPQLLAIGPKMLKGVWDGLKDLDWGKIGTDIINGIVNGFKNASKTIVSGVKNAGNAIKDAFCKFFGIHSPSTMMRDEVGTFLGLGTMAGIEDSITNSIPSVASSLKSKLTKGLSSGLSIDTTGLSLSSLDGTTSTITANASNANNGISSTSATETQVTPAIFQIMADSKVMAEFVIDNVSQLLGTTTQFQTRGVVAS